MMSWLNNIRGKSYYTLEQSSDGVKITIFPARDLDSQIRLGVFFVLQSLFSGMILWQILSETSSFADFKALSPYFLFAAILFFLGHGYVILRVTFLCQKEVLWLAGDELTVSFLFFGLGKKRTYTCDNIKHIRLSTPAERVQGSLCFDYETYVLQETPGYVAQKNKSFLGKTLSVEEAKNLAKILSDIIRFRCHLIETIVFGSSVSSFPIELVTTLQSTLQNPDVTDLTFPFFRLKTLVLDAKSTDRAFVERFLTYAVNSIGQLYIKTSLDVHIYENHSRLPSNLRNSLVNLCRTVYVHVENEEREAAI